MKLLHILAICLVLSVPAWAQKKLSCQFSVSNKKQFDSVVRPPYLVINPQVKKQPGKLLIPLTNQTYKVFTDINVDSDMGEFSYLGDIRGTKISLIRKIELHNERYYLVNQATGMVDSLVGVPVFAANLQEFACLNNPDTWEEQQIQVGTIKENQVIVKGYIPPKPKTFLYSLAHAGKNALFAKDDDGKYWKLLLVTE